MAVSSTVSIKLTQTGDIRGQQTFPTTANASGSGESDVRTLASGFNAITVPTGGTVPKGVIIIPPAGNATAITLKGVTGDTGLRLHDTDPTYLALHSGVSSIGLTAGAEITGVRFLWN